MKWNKNCGKKGILGEDTPEKLRNTVLFLLGMTVTLCGVDEHYHLRCEMPDKESQIQFERDPDGIKCLVYREDSVTKMHDGGIDDRKSDRKEVWVYPHDDNCQRCTVRLISAVLQEGKLLFANTSETRSQTVVC